MRIALPYLQGFAFICFAAVIILLLLDMYWASFQFIPVHLVCAVVCLGLFFILGALK